MHLLTLTPINSLVNVDLLKFCEQHIQPTKHSQVKEQHLTLTKF